MKGSVRSFIHYLAVRDDEGVAQYEHVELARAVKAVFANQFPLIHSALIADKKTEGSLIKCKDEEIQKLQLEVQVLRNQLTSNRL
jgi:thymidylate synthase ThyX